MFKRVLVWDLIHDGAASTEELEGRVRYMGIVWPPEDIRMVLECARRAGLVAPLGHPERADGTGVTRSEWIATNAGQKLAPPPSADEGRQSDFSLHGFRRMWQRLERVARPIGAASVAGALAGLLALTPTQAAQLALFIFLGLITGYVLAEPLLVRVTDWLTLPGWPHYQRTYQAHRSEIDVLRARRKLRARLRKRHLGYWDFIRARAAVLNN